MSCVSELPSCVLTTPAIHPPTALPDQQPPLAESSPLAENAALHDSQSPAVVEKSSSAPGRPLALSHDKRRRPSRTRDAIKVVNATFHSIKAQTSYNTLYDINSQPCLLSQQDFRHQQYQDQDLARPFRKVNLGYLVPATPSDYRIFLKIKEVTRAKRLKTEFDYTREAIFVKMPGGLHEQLLSACVELSTQIRDTVDQKNWKLPNGNALRLISGGGNFPIKVHGGEIKTIVPDHGLRVRHGGTTPFMIFEVGSSQTQESLDKKARVYANGSFGRITLVFLLKFLEKKTEHKVESEDLSLRVKISRIDRPLINNSQSHLVLLDDIYDHSQQLVPNANFKFPNFHILKQDIYGKHTTENRSDTIEVSMVSFNKVAATVLQEFISNTNDSAPSSFSSDQESITSTEEEEPYEGEQDDGDGDPTDEDFAPGGSR